jgi:hypothetical protein
MKLTNVNILPTSLYNAVANDPYDAGASDINVTALIGPAKPRVLRFEFSDQIVEDVSDRLFSLFGQIAHGILERADDGDVNVLTEKRLFIDRHGWKISGAFDRLVLDHAILQDYKLTSVYAVKDGVKPEHEAQANIYALMLRAYGYTVDNAQIVYMLRDWSKGRLKSQRDYPPHQVMVLDVEMWSEDRTEEYLHDRLMAHGTAFQTLPECTAEERWASDSVFKIRKRGNKTSYRLMPTEAAAEAWVDAEYEKIDAGEKPEKIPAKTKRSDIEIFFSPGESRRCADYCNVSPFCEQWAALNPDPLNLGA